MKNSLPRFILYLLALFLQSCCNGYEDPDPVDNNYLEGNWNFIYTHISLQNRDFSESETFKNTLNNVNQFQEVNYHSNSLQFNLNSNHSFECYSTLKASEKTLGKWVLINQYRIRLQFDQIHSSHSFFTALDLLHQINNTESFDIEFSLNRDVNQQLTLEHERKLEDYLPTDAQLDILPRPDETTEEFIPSLKVFKSLETELNILFTLERIEN